MVSTRVIIPLTIETQGNTVLAAAVVVGLPRNPVREYHVFFVRPLENILLILVTGSDPRIATKHIAACFCK